MRIAVASRSVEIVRILRDCLARLPGRFREAWIAYDEANTRERLRTDRPELLLLDLTLAETGEARRRIVATAGCPVLVVTESVAGNVSQVFDALASGAAGAVDMPRSGEAGDAAELLGKIMALTRLSELPSATPSPATLAATAWHNPPPHLVVIGASTGGPQALSTILGTLSPDLAAAIVIIQHVDARLAGGLAQWLAVQTRRSVAIAKEGDHLQIGSILVAGTNDHLTVTAERTLHYTPDPVDCPYRPSVDAFFASAAAHWRGPATAVLLTGMGRDGADGLLRLRQAGWHTIAQDEATSVVYGMPRVAAERQAAVEVLPIEKIAVAIMARVPRSA